MRQFLYKRGVSLIEIIVVVGLMGIVLGSAIINLPTLKNGADSNSEYKQIKQDISIQQQKAMTGVSSGSTSGKNYYGIYFNLNSYTKFRGQVYNPADTTNEVVQLDSFKATTITLPSAAIIFKPGSGEIYGYDAGQNTIVFTANSDGKTKTLTFNKYGVFTEL